MVYIIIFHYNVENTKVNVFDLQKPVPGGHSWEHTHKFPNILRIAFWNKSNLVFQQKKINKMTKNQCVKNEKSLKHCESSWNIYH